LYIIIFSWHQFFTNFKSLTKLIKPLSKSLDKPVISLECEVRHNFFDVLRKIIPPKVNQNNFFENILHRSITKLKLIKYIHKCVIILKRLMYLRCYYIYSINYFINSVYVVLRI